MKAKLLTISAAVMALLAVSCQREETGFGLPAGEEVTVTISASVPSGGPSVKSNANPGNGDQINRCILGVYMVDGENEPQLYGTRVYKQVTGGQATFEDVTLLTGYDYKLVFWADNVSTADNADLTKDNHYVTTGFPKVTYNTAGGHQYESSDDTRDAFYGVFELNDFSGEVQDSYTLTRPFGQLNIFTTDYDDIKMEALKPAKVQMAFTSIPTGLNLLTGETTSGSVTGAVSDIQTITDPVVSGAKQLSFDYVFAPEDQQLIINDIVMSFYDANGSQLAINAYAFPGLPVRANYRTNVSGALLTKSADLKIDISEDFAGTLEKDVYTVSTLAEAETILEKIVNSAAQPEIISITVENQISSTDGKSSIELPAITTEVELNLQGGIASDATFTVRDVMAGTGNGNDFIGRLVLNNASTEQQGSLVINLPEGSAEVAGGSYTSVQVTTADDTFILGSDAEVGSLTINKGTVKLYGSVTGTFTKAEGYTGTVYRCLSDQQSMDNLLDDDYSGYTKVLIERPAEVSGGEKELTVPVEIYSNAEISNLKIKPSAESKVVDVVSVYGEGNDVVLDNCEIYQLFNGSGTTTTSAVRVSGKSQEVSVLNCQIVLDTKFYMQRGINISAATDAEVTVENTHIGVSTDYLPEEYTDQQISAFVDRYDSRGISMHENQGHTVLNIRNNTVVEGAFYAVNWAGASEKVTVNVDDSRLDGRCALNINSGNDNNVYITSSKLIGRNYFTGPTENFAVIVYGYNCEGTDVSVTGNSEIISYNSPQTATNWQFSASLRSPNCGLSLHDVTIREKKTGDVEPRMSFAVEDQYPESNTITSSNVSFDGKEYLQLLPRTVWDGSLKTVPMQTLLMTDDETQYKYSAYLIIQPSDLAWVAEQVNEGNEDARKMSLYFERDIDLGGHSWIPIGYNGNSNINMGEDEYAQTPMFRGSIFGNGHVISNAVVDVKTTARGVFGQVYGDSEAENPTVIYDLNAENIHVKQAGKWSGGLFGYIRNVSIISGCSIKDVTIETGNNPESYFCGGLIGYITSTDGVTVKGCSSENITFPGPETWNCGGLIGKIFGCGDVLIQDCEASKGYMKSYFFNNGQLTGYPGSTYYIAKDGYQNSWFIGNLTNTSGFNLTINNVPDYSGNWTENDSNGGGSIPVETLSDGAFSWPFIGVFDSYSNTTDATIIVNGSTVFPVQ